MARWIITQYMTYNILSILIYVHEYTFCCENYYIKYNSIYTLPPRSSILSYILLTGCKNQ